MQAAVSAAWAWLAEDAAALKHIALLREETAAREAEMSRRRRWQREVEQRQRELLESMGMSAAEAGAALGRRFE